MAYPQEWLFSGIGNAPGEPGRRFGTHSGAGILVLSLRLIGMDRLRLRQDGEEWLRGAGRS